MSSRRKLPSNPLVILLLIAASAAGLLSQRPRSSRQVSLPAAHVEAPVSVGKARVTKIVDGDTVHVLLTTSSGSEPTEEKVRLFGINTPELHRIGVPNFKPEPFAQEAADFLKKLCPPGTEVSLELHDRDKYERLLGVMSLDDGTNINKKLVEQGLAKSYFPYTSKHSPLRPEYEGIQARAIEAKRGIWSLQSTN